MQEVQIVLVRHGETAWSKMGKHTGRTDIDLTPHGREQAAAVGLTLKSWTFSHRFSSPLSRALETARLSGVEGEITILDDLMEWNYGELEGQTNNDIVAKFPYFDKWSAKSLPEGESVDDVGKRASSVIDIVTKAAQDGPVLVTAHGHLLSILIAVWLDLHPREGRRFVLETATATVLGIKRGDRILRLLNHRVNLVSDIPMSDERTIAHSNRY